MPVLMRGNDVVGEAAIRAGCRYYFGYPITPQNEVMGYLAWRLPEVGGSFLQAESEVAAINMVFGAAGAGGLVMTSSSSPGISLKQEGISYISAAEVPCVIVNVMRGGPGLGGIQPSQSDYYQATRGGGHGDYRTIVLAPMSIQETADLTYEAFELAQRYRIPVLVLTDGTLGQMMEPVDLPPFRKVRDDRPWATTGCRGRERRLVKSLFLDPEELERHNQHLQDKYLNIMEAETRFEDYRTGDAEMLICAFGICGRVARSVVDHLREQGLKVGLFRPITLWPFPAAALQAAAVNARKVLTVELNAGQMVDDVRLALPGKDVGFYGRMGGLVVSAKELEAQIRSLMGGESQ